MRLMNESGITVYLRMPAGSLFHRLAESKANRPLIAGLTDLKLMDYIIETLGEREHFYMQAQHVVRGENLKADKILELLKIQS
jgi:shikimate kinase